MLVILLFLVLVLSKWIQHVVLLLHQDGLLEVDQQVQVLFLQDFLSGRERGADEPRYDSEKDEINSREHNSIIFSYTTKTFPNCTAVSELHMEITPHQIFTLLGPVFLLIGFHLEWMWKDHVVNQSSKDNFYIIDGNKKFRICNAASNGKIRMTPDTIYARYNTEIGKDNQIPLWLFGFLY